MYSLADVAKILNLSEMTIRRMVNRYKNGETVNVIKAVKIGRRWRVTEEEVDRIRNGG